jgi:hypothetical protein
MDKEKVQVEETETDESRVTEESEAGEDKNSSEDETRRGEGHGNLRRRSEWFQKRHGGG